MNDNVHDLTTHAYNKGAEVFLGCPDCEEADHWSIVVVHSPSGPIISSLVCTSAKCSANVGHAVVNGKVEV